MPLLLESLGTGRHHYNNDDIIGSYSATYGEEVEHEFDCPMDNYTEQDITVVVSRNPGAHDKDIYKALLRELESGPCGHDWDCCGCTIVQIFGLKVGAGDVWTGKVHISRNY